MKNRIWSYLLSAVVLILTCSFANAPATTGTSVEDAIIATPVGGAFLNFAGKNGGEITKKEMEGQRELKVDGCAAGAKVLKYTLDITRGGKTSTMQSETNVLNQEMLTKLRSLSAGDSFQFKQVKARLVNSNDVVDVDSRKFVVVDKA